MLTNIQIVDEIPKSPTGKIQRKVMREWAKRDAQELKDSPPKAKL
jgi:4-coumarate--CoA ligase